MRALSVGFPGREKWSVTPRMKAQRSSSLLMNSGSAVGTSFVAPIFDVVCYRIDTSGQHIWIEQQIFYRIETLGEKAFVLLLH